jgi:hypothetical protein
MTDSICPYSGDRDQAIVSYLYDDSSDFDAVDRAAFGAHLPACDRCRTELAAFGDVRSSLGSWSPPEAATLHTRAGAVERKGWWRDIPAWAQVAAALLVLGVSAGIANLDVRYDANGLRIRTGWSAIETTPAARTAAASDAPSRSDLTALEQRLRTEFRQAAAAGTASAAPATAAAIAARAASETNREILLRARALVDDSERRQQRELALRLAEAMRDLNAQRQEDLVRIDRNIGAIQNNTGREMLRQRSEMLNYVTVRTASQKPQ